MFPLFAAKKIYRSMGSSGKVSSLASGISVAGITLGISIILISFAIILGFKGEIKHKIYGFCSDIRVTSLDYSTSFETMPVNASDSILQRIRSIEGIARVQRYTTKPGMIKTADDFQGIVLKGIGSEYDMNYIRNSLVDGSLPSYSPDTTSSEVLVSETLSRLLGIKTGDDIYTYFIGNTVQARKLSICGLYQTNISNYDNSFVIADINLVNRLNKWDGSMASGLEISAVPGTDPVTLMPSVYSCFETDFENSPVILQTPEDIHPDIFSWLDILDMNVLVILILMFGLSFFTIVSGLLIIILERVGMIGTLKALGASNRQIKQIFLGVSSMIVVKGLVIGNILALAVYIIQSTTHLIRLDSSVYYIDYVPMHLPAVYIIGLNAVTLLFSFLVLMIPAIVVSHISPTKTIRFD